jgi:hypothetical protein
MEKTLTYYTKNEYDDILARLPELIKQAKESSEKILEPTIVERTKIYNLVKKFIKDNSRIVYGGFALNYAIRVKNSADAFYPENGINDIEFYSSQPKLDIVKLADIIKENGFKDIVAKEANHEATFTLFVNFVQYCDITYIDKKIEYSIQTLKGEDGINYAHPHFMLIDYLRIFIQPLTAAESRWEKSFKRYYLLLKYYPVLSVQTKLNLSMNMALEELYGELRKFFSRDKIKECSIVTGIAAYNYYIKYVTNECKKCKKKIQNYVVTVPYLEIDSVSYLYTVEESWLFLKEILGEAIKNVSVEEFYPLFQFTGYSIVFKYNNDIILKITQKDGYCIPYIETQACNYVTYQYLLMCLNVDKFQSFITSKDQRDKNFSKYDEYRTLITNVIIARNDFLSSNRLSPLNDTIFSEFTIQCVGTTMDFRRESLIRGKQRIQQGKRSFIYNPEQKHDEQKRKGFIDAISAYKPFNASGTSIKKPSNKIFVFDQEKLTLSRNIKSTDTDTDTDAETEIETEIETETGATPNKLSRAKNLHKNKSKQNKSKSIKASTEDNNVSETNDTPIQTSDMNTYVDTNTETVNSIDIIIDPVFSLDHTIEKSK